MRPPRSASAGAAALCTALALASACRPSADAGAPPSPAAEDEARAAAGAPESGRSVGGQTATDGDWKGTSVARVEELFEGRFPGVRVLRLPGGGISVRVRGGSTLNGSDEPLFVIDGMPIEPGPGGLIGINPADIAKIEILKDIGSTSFYGVRGGNGVVLITTKRPR